MIETATVRRLLILYSLLLLLLIFHPLKRKG